MSTLRPVPGSLCRVRPHREGPQPALVLVVAHLTETLTRVRLLTNEIEMGTDTEHVLPRSGPVRRYDLLVHEFPGYVRTVDLEPALSVIDMGHDLQPSHNLPVTGPQDPRWGWKITELGRLQALQPSLAEILGEEPQDT